MSIPYNTRARAIYFSFSPVDTYISTNTQTALVDNPATENLVTQ